MSRSKYSVLIPKAAQRLDVREQGEEFGPKRQSEVALRRWGRPFSPLAYQQEVISGIRRMRVEQKTIVVGLISLPTGAGKTLTTSHMVAEVLGESEEVSIALWIAPQRELLFQAFDAMRVVWTGGPGPSALDLRIVLNKTHLPTEIQTATVFFCTPHHAAIMIKRGLKPSVVVFDEAHHVAAPTFLETWNLARDSDGLKLAIGLSATPIRLEDREFSRLLDAFDHRLFLPRALYPNPIGELINVGVLARPTFCAIDGVPSFARADGLGARRSMEALTADLERWYPTVAYVARTELQTAVFAPNRDYGSAFVRHLRHLGIRAEYIDGQDTIAERMAAFTRFDSRQTRVLVTVNLFIEGVDCPAAEQAVLTYPVRSQIRLSQIIGRVLRGPTIGGKARAVVAGVEGSQEQLDDSLELRPYQISAWRDLHLLS